MHHRGYGATVARLTPDQKVGNSNLSARTLSRVLPTPRERKCCGTRAHPDLNQGPADLQSAALTTELCTHLASTEPLSINSACAQRVNSKLTAGSKKRTWVSHQGMQSKDTLAEWLRRRPAKPMGSPRVGSNPTGVKFEQLCFSFTRPGYAGMARAKVTLKKSGRFRKPKLHLSDERTMPREAKHLRLCKRTK